MVELKAHINITQGVNGASLIIPLAPSQKFDIKQDKSYIIKIKEYREKRSLNANAYCWALCEKLAKALTAKGALLTKEDIYIAAIKTCGVFDEILIMTKALKRFINTWTSRGTGWVVDIVNAVNEESTHIRVYRGSSSYDTKEMTRLIEYLVEECKSQNIPTLDDDDLQSLIDNWYPMEKA